MITTRRLVTIGLVCLAVALLAGCATSFEEWSGTMSNETGRHVQPLNFNNPDDNSNSQAVRPSGRLEIIRKISSTVDRGGFWPTFTPSLLGLGRHSTPRASWRNDAPAFPAGS
ncbi:MAG: hypothetical protein ACRD2B_17810 [Terriglobia bacterium]